MNPNETSQVGSASSNQKLSSNIKYFILAAAIVALAVVFFVYRSVVYRTEVSDFTLTAGSADAAGVTPESTFTLQTTASLTPQVLESFVKFSPAIKFNIKKAEAAENTFEIIPSEPLSPNQIYTIQIEKGPLASRSHSWAYQVKAPFDVVSSIPGPRAIDVPVKTGIEIYFNRENILSPEKFIEITPATAGKFTTDSNMVRFVPNQPLKDQTIYKIKIKPGLGAKGTTDTLDSEKVIEFQTHMNRSTVSAYFMRNFTEFNPENDQIFGVTVNNINSVNATVYKFSNAQEFIEYLKKSQSGSPWARYYSEEELKLPDNKKILSSSVPVETSNVDGYYSPRLIRMPQKFGVGYYAVIIKSGQSTDISWFQVNPAASFAAFAGSKSIFWLKNISTGINLSDITVSYNGKQVGKTNNDGVVTFDTPKELFRDVNKPYYYNAKDKQYFIAEIPSGPLVIPAENEYGGVANLTENSKWWDYVSLNKNLYLPNDTIRFWAIGKPRQGKNNNEEVTVKLTSQYWQGNQEGIVTYAETKVKLSDFDTLTGELSFSGLKPGGYELSFLKGDEIISKQYVSVAAYVKPAYKISLTPDKSTVFAGDLVTFTVKGEFFDGTPVVGANLEYVAYRYGKSFNGQVELDANGTAFFVVRSEYFNGHYWPSYMNVSIKPTQAEESLISSSADVYVFGPRVVNTIEQNQVDGKVTFDVTTRQVVINDSKRSQPYWDRNEYLGAPVSGANTSVSIDEVLYIREQVRTGYDPITKVSYPIYNYGTQENPISSHVLTADANGKTQLVYNTTAEKTYKFVFKTLDANGRADTITRYVYGISGYANHYVSDYEYRLQKSGDSEYKIGDPIKLTLKTDSGETIPNASDKFIFLTANNGNLEYKIQDSGIYNATFQAKDVPNISIWSGWFADGRFHNTYNQNLSFNADERRLNITVTTDKPTYKPGEKVNLGVKVTDKNNNPVSAEVNLSVLDEAVFSVRPWEMDLLNTLYKDLYSQVVIRTSNVPPYGGGGAEKGGGGDGDGLRSDIEEVALFKTIKTDSNGQAKVEFELPDNITSWRVTSQALTKDLFAGKNIKFIPVTLPFFVDTTLNQTYLDGDSLFLRMRTFGTQATNQGNISYTIQSPTLPFQKIETTGSARSFSYGPINLTPGNHTLNVYAKDGNLNDGISRTVNVLRTYFTKNLSDVYQGKVGLKIENKSQGYTSLTFGNLERNELYKVLKESSYQWGMRLDQKGTKAIALKWLNDYFGETSNDTDEFEISKYQSYTGGLQLLPYSSEELEITALSAHLFDQSVLDRSSLKSYFNKTMTDSKADVSRISRALFGLSAFGEPILTKVQSLKNDSALSLTDKVYVALALNALGSKEEARVYYMESIKPSTETKSSYSYVRGLAKDETITTTALLAALTASFESPDAPKYKLYVDENYPKETLNNFQKLLYVKLALPTVSTDDISFAFEARSQKESKTLKGNETFTLHLSPEEMSSFQMTKSEGNVGITASYEAESSPASIVKDKNLTLTRSYEVRGRSTKEFNEGDTVLIRLDADFSGYALNGMYQVVDFLPSGLRPMDEESVYRYTDQRYRRYPSEINNQKVTFIVDKDNTLPIYYYAHVVTKGTYKAEPALLQSLRSQDVATISNADSVTIK